MARKGETEYSRWKRSMAKLDNQIRKDRAEYKRSKEFKEGNKQE